ncbi:hypothetical protein [Phytohabitans houttuyneae]|uniref:Uncharacterized protein n=1 Tax=Phytohabitans houttuyneae TaxID=1076126 RepID=A0A6V8KBQ9_9ACTN|nr:hypothetical protein [Phytohabitans houttuyneae]GFJ79579.1 hypothetical protein Phou_037590 [Phytohabitans houttuyneae]
MAVSLPDRPAVTTPAAGSARQPYVGLKGLLLVVPVAALLAYGAGGPESSLRILGPLVTFALPAVAMVAFWWEDWPGSSLRPGWSGLVDTIFVAALAVVLAAVGLLVVEGWDPGGVFAGRAFPETMPLGAAGFVAMLQLTLVTEGWPLRRYNRFAAGLAALALSWAVALAVYATGVHRRPWFGAFLILVGVWQVWWFVVWRGWPLTGIHAKAVRLVAGNAVVLCGAALTWLLVGEVGGVEPGVVGAVGGSFVAAGLVVAMLFEGWLTSYPAALAMTAAVTVAIYALVTLAAGVATWTRAEPEAWVAHATLNAIGVSVILHVAIGRRFPFGDTA